MTPHPDHDLLQAYLDRELGVDASTALEKRLASDASLADALAVMAREEAILSEWSAATRAAEQATQAAAAASIKPALASRPSRIRALRLLVAAAIAASLLAIVVHLSLPQRPAAAQAVATLEQVQGEVNLVGRDGNVKPAAEGDRIFAGQEILTGEDDSSTVVRVRDCRLVLVPETHVRVGDETISDSPLVYLAEGVVQAEVSRNSTNRPVVIRSPLAEMRGLMGKFNFASLPGGTFFETSQGSARLTRKSDGHTIEVTRGKSVVVHAKSGRLESRVMAVNAATPLRTLNAGAAVRSLFFEPEGTSLLTCGGDSVKRWEIPSGKLVGTIYSQKRKPIRQFSASLDGRLLALCNEERAAKVIDAFSGADQAGFRNGKRLMALALSPDGRALAVSWSGGKLGHELRLYDPVLGLEQSPQTGHAGPVVALAYSPRGTYLATSGVDRCVRVWSTSDLETARVFAKLPSEARCLAFSPDERWLALGGRNGEIRIFDLQTGSLRHVLVGHLRQVNVVSFSPDGSRLASVSADGTARLWQADTGIELSTLRGHTGNVLSAAFSQDGRLLGTGGADRRVLMWDLAALQPE